MQTLSLPVISKKELINVVRLVVFISLCIALSSEALATQKVDDWQKQRLLHPTPAQRAYEQQGRVFIYDGLSEQEIKQAMDQNFERIQAMMFIHDKKATPDKAGSANKGDTGEADDDGC